MNILILESQQFIDPDRATLSSRQQKHLKNILKLSTGDSVKIGKINGLLGSAELFKLEDQFALRNITLDTPPPAALDFKIILAMPRPQMLKRILQSIAIFGVSELILIQSNRVEKSFWQSPSATDSAIREQLILGLEQAKATQLPNVRKFTRFRPFVEDACPSLTAGYKKLIAHPGEYPLLPSGQGDKSLALAIGPEGGFTAHEVEMFESAGFSPVQMGARILKVETAITAFLGRLY